MAIMDRLLGGKKDAEAESGAEASESPVREGVPVGMNSENAVLNITPGAQEKIAQILSSGHTRSALSITYLYEHRDAARRYAARHARRNG